VGVRVGVGVAVGTRVSVAVGGTRVAEGAVVLVGLGVSVAGSLVGTALGVGGTGVAGWQALMKRDKTETIRKNLIIFIDITWGWISFLASLSPSLL